MSTYYGRISSFHYLTAYTITITMQGYTPIERKRSIGSNKHSAISGQLSTSNPKFTKLS